MSRVRARRLDRNLVSRGSAFDASTLDHLRSSPALRRSQKDHRPAWTIDRAILARGNLDLANAGVGAIERVPQLLVHQAWIRSGNDVSLPPDPRKELREILVARARRNGRARDLEPVEMQY